MPPSALPELGLPDVLRNDDTPRVEQIMFVASHTFSHDDRRLLLHYSRQLRFTSAMPWAMRLWLLHYEPSFDHMMAQPQGSSQIEAGVATWGDGAVRHAFPTLGHAMDSSPALAATPDRNHRFTYSCAV